MTQVEPDIADAVIPEGAVRLCCPHCGSLRINSVQQQTLLVALVMWRPADGTEDEYDPFGDVEVVDDSSEYVGLIECADCHKQFNDDSVAPVVSR